MGEGVAVGRDAESVFNLGDYEGMARAAAAKITNRFPRLQGRYDDVLCDCYTEVWLASRDFDKARGTKRTTLVGTYLLNLERKYAKAYYITRNDTHLDDVIGYEEDRDAETLVGKMSQRSRDIFTSIAVAKRGSTVIKYISKGSFVVAHGYLKKFCEAGYSELLRLVIELIQLGEIAVGERTCDKCRHWDDDECYLNPSTVVVSAEHHCGQFSRKLPSKEVLETDVALLPDIPPRIKSLLSNLGLKTVEDLLLVGPGAIRMPDSLWRVDVTAIRLIRASLEKLEVVW